MNQTRPAMLGANNKNEIEPLEKVPAWAKPFVGRTVAEFLGRYIPRPKLEAMAGAMFGLVDLGIEIPEWAKNSSRQFWKNYVGNRQLNPKESAEDLGVIVIMVGEFTQGNLACSQPVAPPSKLEKFFSRIAKKFYSLLMQEVVSKLSHEEKAQFYTGCATGEQMVAQIKNPDHLVMVKLAPLYLVVSLAWRKIQWFETHAAREKWLRDEKVIKDNVTSREVYQVFSIIELPGAKPGHPKQPAT
jgi:hypothetical protein